MHEGWIGDDSSGPQTFWSTTLEALTKKAASRSLPLPQIFDLFGDMLRRIWALPVPEG
jgi:hypothetical protein